MNKTLYITICATKSYTYALIGQARRVIAMILDSPFANGTVLLVGDQSTELKNAAEFYAKELPSGWNVDLKTADWKDGHENYKVPAQLVISQMRSVAFDAARKNRASYVLSLDSDVLPPPHALKVMHQSLLMSDGFYDIATAPYSSQGGGDWLGGRGIPERPILPDCHKDEYILPPELRARLLEHEAQLGQMQGVPDEAWMAAHGELDKLIESCPRKGDPFFLNSNTGVLPFVGELKKRLAENNVAFEHVLQIIDDEVKHWMPRGFRRRGWLSSAYPGIGIGAIVPVDWCGFGCTLMSAEALRWAQFDGYGGKGTEDLYVVWKRWFRAGLRINCITHCPCDHVIRDKEKPGQFILLQAFHETRDPECVGHLRVEKREWVQQTVGENVDSAA